MLLGKKNEVIYHQKTCIYVFFKVKENVIRWKNGNLRGKNSGIKYMGKCKLYICNAL